MSRLERTRHNRHAARAAEPAEGGCAAVGPRTWVVASQARRPHHGAAAATPRLRHLAKARQPAGTGITPQATDCLVRPSRVCEARRQFAGYTAGASACRWPGILALIPGR